MRTLKIILFVLAALLGIFLLLGLVAPKEIQTSQSIVIEAPPEAVFDVVNDLTSWESWSPWKENDPTIRVVMGEPSSGEGAYYTWASENSGSGKMTIAEIRPAESIRMVVEFEGQGQARAPFTFKPTENGVETTWAFQSEFPYPWNAMLLFQDFQGSIDKDYRRGLELLKGVVEERAATVQSKPEVLELDAPARYYIGIREKAGIDALAARFAVNFPKVYDAVSKAGLEMGGMPSALYYIWDEANNSTDLAFAIPVKSKGEVKGFETIEIPAGKMLLVDYYGNYEGIGEAHIAVDQYLAAKGLKAGIPVIEEYVTDPQAEPDTAKWLTKVYYPLAQ